MKLHIYQNLFSVFIQDLQEELAIFKFFKKKSSRLHKNNVLERRATFWTLDIKKQS